MSLPRKSLTTGLGNCHMKKRKGQWKVLMWGPHGGGDQSRVFAKQDVTEGFQFSCFFLPGTSFKKSLRKKLSYSLIVCFLMLKPKYIKQFVLRPEQENNLFCGPSKSTTSRRAVNFSKNAQGTNRKTILITRKKDVIRKARSLSSQVIIKSTDRNNLQTPVENETKSRLLEVWRH